jgi:hypothetical protein
MTPGALGLASGLNLMAQRGLTVFNQPNALRDIFSGCFVRGRFV